MSPLSEVPESGPIADAPSRIGKLVVFAGIDSDAGTEFCTAGVAIRLARSWHCLAMDLGSEPGTLRKYLPPNSANQKPPTALHVGLASLETLKTKSRVTNIDLIESAMFPDTQTVLSLLAADPADYILATVGPGSSTTAMDLFCIADVPIIVTVPGATAFEKAMAFLERAGSRLSSGRSIYVLLNRVQRAGEETEMTGWIEAALPNLGIGLSLIAAVTYDSQAEAGLQQRIPTLGAGPQGVSGFAFEELASKIERLLPRNRSKIAGPPKPGNGLVRLRAGLLDFITSPFAEKNKQMPDLEARISDLERTAADRRSENQHLKEIMETVSGEREGLARRLTDAETLLREKSDRHEDMLARTAESLQLANAILAEAKDSLAQKDDNHRVAETNAAGISELQDRLREKDATIAQLESTVRVLEEANSRMKLELMAALENRAARPAPEVLLRARDTVIEKLRAHPPQSITILCIDAGGHATYEFSVEMRSILESAGWSVKLMKSSFDSGQFYGMQVVDDGSEPSATAAGTLCSAFQSARLSFVRKVAPAGAKVSTLRLIVGRHNWHP